MGIKTIKIKDENITLEEFKEKWSWTIGQFKRLYTIDDFATYQNNLKKLEDVANEMLENSFNDMYNKQNKEDK